MKLLLLVSAVALFSAPKNIDVPKYLTIGKIPTLKINQGKSEAAIVPVEIQQGFHIQANPAATKELIPTTVEVTAEPGFEISTPDYPPGKQHRLQNWQNEISVYGGKIEIKIGIKASDKAKPGKHNLKALLKYQPCNDAYCLFPQKAPFQIPIVVSK